MDTSKKYIEMCKGAKEIQKLWGFSDGDCMVAPSGEIWVVCDYYSAACYNRKEKKEDHPQAHESYFNEYSDTFRNFDGGYEWEDKLIAKRKECIWLPRQDQLQEMLDKWTLLGKIRGLFDFCEPEFMCPDEPPCKEDEKLGLYVRKTFSSAEQLWLGFMMKEKYDKTWNGEEWVK